METIRITSGPVFETITQRFWWIWLLAITVVAMVLSATLEFAPFLFMDELMGVDFGRVILNSGTNWSVAWMTESGEPVYLLSYVGAVLQELAYQIGGQMGPRFSALVGALAAATCLVGWLRARGTAEIAALVLGLVFVLDPTFVQAYTTGRVDGWAMALCLGCCWLLRVNASHPVAEKPFKQRILLAGTLAALSLFTWPSAGFLFPLILFELIMLARSRRLAARSWRQTSLPIALFLAGGLGAGLLLLIPIAAQVYQLAGSMVEALQVNTQHGGALSEQPVLLRLTLSFVELLRVLKFTPVLLVGAVAGAVWKRETGIILGGLLAALLMMSTVVYISRVQYLLPYLAASAAALYQGKTAAQRPFYRIRLWGLGFAFAWSVGLTLFARTLVAVYEREYLNRELVHETALKMLGPGNYSVALFYSFEFYYAGRSLGWKMYAPYKPAFADISLQAMQQLLPHVDYAIIPQELLTKDYASLLKKEGMSEKGTFIRYKHPADKDYVKDHSKTTNMDRLHIVYRILEQPYGPYKLFARPVKNPAGMRSHQTNILKRGNM